MLQKNPDASRLLYQADYSSHPAFAAHVVWDAAFDFEVDGLADRLNAHLQGLQAALILKRTTLLHAAEEISSAIVSVIDLLIRTNRGAGHDFTSFARPFHREILRILIDDLACFDRRNSYVPVIWNSTELALRNELATSGFLEFDISRDEIDLLWRRLAPYVNTIETRHRQGKRSREDLSINETDPGSVAMVNDLFERRGLNKAVSDVLHEKAEAVAFALELSPEGADWWHSRYEDVGLLQPNRSAYFHNDEGRSIFKAIVYLSDVDENEGPFGYVPETFHIERPPFEWAVARATLTTLQSGEIRAMMTDMDPVRGVFTSRLARRFFGMLPPRLRLNSHFGFDVLDGGELARLLESQEVRMTGPAGQAIVLDGSRLVHRGGLVRSGRRWALQVVFEVGRKTATAVFNQMREKAERTVYAC